MASLLQTLLQPCAARIEILPRQMALQIAMNEYLIGGQSNKLTIWTDGSYRGSKSGFAMVWRNTSATLEWNEQLFMLDSYSSVLAEFFAFSEGMKLAVEQCKKDSTIFEVVVYTDCQSVLEIIQDFHTRPLSRRRRFSRQLELAQIKAQVNELHSMGNRVVFRWVPGHSQVPGNERADELASKASKATYEYSLIEKLMPPSNGYLESPPIQREERVSLREIRHGRIEKLSNSRRDLPLKRLYTARIQKTIQDMEVAMAKTMFDTLDEAIDKEIAENETRDQLMSLSGRQV